MPRYSRSRSRSRSSSYSRSPRRNNGGYSNNRGGNRSRSPSYGRQNNNRYNDRRQTDRYNDNRRDNRYNDNRRNNYDDRNSRMVNNNRRNLDRLRHMGRNDRYDDRRGGGRYDDRRGGNDRRYDDRRGGRRRSPSPEQEFREEFRHPSLSRSQPNEDDRKNWHCDRMELEEKQVAYVFGKMGSTKDKIARVSGARVDLVGQELVFQGKKEGVERAMGYVKILLSQRSHGDTIIELDDHKNDVTLVQVPTSCKGFITGKKGSTLRQIEKEYATLMTFCKTTSDDRNEPLAIFGSKRGRLGAQLKVMSIVEGKEPGFYYMDRNSKFPTVDTVDPKSDDWGVDFMPLPKEYLGFVLGSKGSTRLKLEIASGCLVEYIGKYAAFGGYPEDQKRGRDYVTWLLNSRRDNDDSWSRVETRGRKDVEIIWVPESSVGYVTGVKANTLRKLEKSTGTFCFFEKKSGRVYEKMLIFSHLKSCREKAIEEVKTIVVIHQRKIGGESRIIMDADYDGEDLTKRGRSYSKSNSRSKSARRSSKSPRRSSKSNSPKNSRSRSYSRSASPQRT